MPQYSTKQDFLCYNIFTSDYACMNTRKSRVIRGKLHHCQKAILERDQPLRITSIIAKNKPHALHECHLHTMKVVMILIPSFHARRQEHLGSQPLFCVLYMKIKKRLADYESQKNNSGLKPYSCRMPLLNKKLMRVMCFG